jgi:hypothetical protein
VKLWSASDATSIVALGGHPSSVTALAVSPDGTFLAAGSAGRLKLWDIQDPTDLATLLAHESTVHSVAFAPDGTMLASGAGDQVVKLWDVATRTEIATLVGHSGAVRSVAFSPDGSTIVSAGEDKTVRIWDVAARAEIATLRGHSGEVVAVAFSPDGTFLASGSLDGTVIFWAPPALGADPAPVVAHLRTWVFDPDGNRNGVAEVGERVLPRVRLANESLTDATNVQVTLTVDDPDVTIVNGVVTHTRWPAGIRQNNDGLILDIAPDATPHTVELTVNVTADYGGAWQFTYPLVIEAAPPNFARRKSWVFDPDANRNGKAQVGERVRPRVRLGNESLGAAENVSVTLTIDDPDITVVNGVVTHAEWPAGVARNNDGFVLDISPDATPHDVEVTVDVTADNGGPWQFTYALAIGASSPEFARRRSWVFDPDGNRNGKAEVGERVRPRVRLGNDDLGAAENVSVTLTIDDPDITVVNGVVSHADWAAGISRNNDGFVLDISADATPHDVEVTVDVTADNGGPWQFTYTLEIMDAAVQFGQLAVKGWALDKNTGDGDGSAEPGEQVEVRARLSNIGVVDATNVVAALSAANTDVTVTADTVSHATWPAGVSRNNQGFIVDIGSDFTGSSVRFTLDVTADGGGRWSFTLDVPVVTPARFEQLAVKGWVFDRDTGDGDGLAEPGEQVAVRARLSNVGNTDAANVVVTLSSGDANVTVTEDTVTHATWPGGVARNNFGFVVDLGAGLTSSSVALDLNVTADGGGPWDFSFTIPVSLPAAPTALAAPGDIDTDGMVGIRDILALAALYGEPSALHRHADLNGDGTLDIEDMVAVHDVRDDVIVGAPVAGHSLVRLVERWQREGRRADDGSAVFREGLPALDALLASLRPGATALLPNFPNPYNPETWIPFDLAEAGDVTIRVYDLRGQLTRRLELGYIHPGKYRDRATAAHWDGRNEFGEAVASGVYLYEMRVGAHREMRRMVMRK